MKIVYVEMGTKGHSIVYLKNLIKGHEEESVLLVSKEIDDLKCQQVVVKKTESKNRHFLNYYLWLLSISNLVDSISPDIVHFLDGDLFYRFFGLGLFRFKKYKVVLTLHWVRSGFVCKHSLRHIAKSVTCVVVHSEFLKCNLEQKGILNSRQIEYPYFNTINVEKDEACKYWGLNPDIKTLASIGSTRFDKGIDILISALAKIQKPFQLLVAGQVNAFTEAELLSMVEPIKDKVYLNIHYLSEKELAYAFAASDYVVLPYRKTFNGASGPLTEGVAFEKCIIGSDHQNLGHTIKTNHLGYTFICENSDDLARVIDTALEYNFTKDNAYYAFKEKLNPVCFRNNYRRLYWELLQGNGR